MGWIVKAMEENSHVADKELATALYLSLRLERPLLVEGNPNSCFIKALQMAGHGA